MTANAGICVFTPTGPMNNSDDILIDNVVITGQTKTASVIKDNITAGANADLTDGNPASGDLVVSADAFGLEMGDTLVITYDVVVDDPAPSGVTSYTNEAMVSVAGLGEVTDDVTLNLTFLPTPTPNCDRRPLLLRRHQHLRLHQLRQTSLLLRRHQHLRLLQPRQTSLLLRRHQHLRLHQLRQTSLLLRRHLRLLQPRQMSLLLRQH